jgi:hypothetical protein
MGKELFYRHGVYRFGNPENEGSQAFFIAYCKDRECGRGEYAEEIDVFVSFGPNVKARAKKVAQAALDRDYEPGLWISRIEYQGAR